MSDFFAQVERELSLASARRAHLPWHRRGALWLRRPLGRLRLALIALALGAGSTAALAAGGVILTGSPVRTIEHPSATAGQGMPLPGGSRLLPLRVADPAGGLPWGMRVVRTTRGLVCVQIGRVRDGVLGELGTDGAFHDDGLFHPLPADALPDVSGAPDPLFVSRCGMPGNTFAGDIVGLEANAATDPRTGGSSAGRREISFGLLGPHAVSVEYRSGAQTLTRRVLPGLGAYLIVQRYTSGRPLGSFSETDGNEAGSDRFPASPNGVLTAITYRFGRLCTDTGKGSADTACGITETAPRRAPALPAAHPPLSVRLHVHGGTITGADISFRAPYPVRSASEGYILFMRACPGLGGGSSDRDVARGGRVEISIDAQSLARAFSCGRTVTVRVEYWRAIEDLPNGTPIGTVTLRRPAGVRTVSPLRPPADRGATRR